MRVIMLGTGPFAVPTLQKLAASGHEIALVITRPPTGRSAEASPLQRAGESLNLEVWAPSTVNAPDPQSRIASLAPDLLVVCDYGEILRPETLATSRIGGINLHGSLLPKYRGAAPVQWAILNGETETGNSVIQMTPGLDAGPLLAQQRTPIDPDEDAEQLEARLAALGADAVLGVVDERRHQTHRTGQKPDLESAPPQEGTRRHRLVAARAGDQKPDPRAAPVAASIHFLAAVGRRPRSGQCRPSRYDFVGSSVRCIRHPRHDPGCHRTTPRRCRRGCR
jgi:methionyl-tRNA formyltransferase